MEATYFASSARTLDNLDFCQFSAINVVLILSPTVDFVVSVSPITALQDQQYHRFRPPQALKPVHGDLDSRNCPPKYHAWPFGHATR